jgi:hypothetical protein
MSLGGAGAKSCSDVMNTCMKMYAGQVHGKQIAGPDAESQCRIDYNGCMQTGTWAGKTVTVKGLEKK